MLVNETHVAAHREHKDQTNGVSACPSFANNVKTSNPTPTQKDVASYLEAFSNPYNSSAKFKKIANSLQASFFESLRGQDTHRMLPTFVHDRESDSEGRYLALDLGGSTLRVAFIEITASSSTQLNSRKWEVTPAVKQYSGQKFFQWIALHVKETLVEAGQDLAQRIPMGLIFSFPLEQTATDNGKLLPMGKGYLVSDELAGHDIKSLFEEAFQQEGLNIVFTVVLNDTVASLLSKRVVNPLTELGLILGTGCNAAASYPVKVFGLTKRGLLTMEDEECELVNTELDQFGADVLPATKWDIELDAACEKPGFQPLEQMVSGRYLGEIMRRLIVDLVGDCGLFDGTLPRGFEIPYAFTTATMAVIEADETEDLSQGFAAFTQNHPLSHRSPSLEEMQLLRQCCLAVSNRASDIVALSVVVLLTVKYESDEPLQARAHSKLRRSFGSHDAESAKLTTEGAGNAVAATGPIGVAACGTVIEKYPRFLERCQATLDRLWADFGLRESVGTNVELEITLDSDCLVGAAEAARCLVSN